MSSPTLEVIESLNLALGEFEKSLAASGLFNASDLKAISTQRQQEVSVLKDNLTSENVSKFYQRLNNIMTFCEKISNYRLARPYDKEAVPTGLKNFFTAAQQNAVQDNIALAKALLTEKPTHNLDVILKNSAKRLDIMTQQVENPLSIISFVELAQTTQKVSNLKHSPVKNFLLSGLKTLVGVGGVTISAALLIASHGSALPLATKLGLHSLSIITECINEVFARMQTPSLSQKNIFTEQQQNKPAMAEVENHHKATPRKH